MDQIVMEYMDRGALADILSPQYPLPEPHIAYVCRCLLLALDALHSKNRIHRGPSAIHLLTRRYQERQHPFRLPGPREAGGFWIRCSFTEECVRGCVL